MNPSAWYVSSSGEGLSATIGGASIMGIAQAVSLVFTISGHPVEQGSIVDLINGVLTSIGAAYAVFGIGRKIFLSFKTPSAPQQ